MPNKNLNNRSGRRNRPGIVLLVTLVLLVMLSALGYTLSSRIAAQRHREQYIIDYQAARYGCDSAAKYAFVKLQDINTPLIERPNEPDFSDLFHLDESEYKELLVKWAEENAAGKIKNSSGTSDAKDANSSKDANDANDVNTPKSDNAARKAKDISDINDVNDINDINDVSDANDTGFAPDFNDPNSLVVRGPYGPPWPLIIKPIELQIGSTKISIEIEDEEAKYPIGWVLLEGEEVERDAAAGFETFCEWMDINDEQIDLLKQDFEKISEIKKFQVDFSPVTVSEKTETAVSVETERRTRGRRVSRTRSTQKTISPSVHITDFAKLFHGSLINTEALAEPTILTDNRKESALKYMGLWASNKVNINTAPRQVLEAAFTFGGDADKIAEEIIQRRRIKPFKDIEDLRKSLLKYSDSIAKCEKYITTTSRFFTVRITAVSGVAEASIVFAITKDGKKIEKIAAISG